MNDDELTHLAKITKRDEALLLELAEKIHNISLLFMPVLAFLGFVVSIELLESGVSSTVIACVAAFAAVMCLVLYAIAAMSKLIAKMLAHIADVVLADERLDVHALNLLETKQSYFALAKMKSSETHIQHDAICPSCELEINMNDDHCPKCRAIFAEGSPWAPIPKSKMTAS